MNDAMEDSGGGQEREGARSRFAFVVGWASLEVWRALAPGGDAFERMKDGSVAAFDRPESLESFAASQGWEIEGWSAPLGVDMARVEVWSSQPTRLPLDPGDILQTWSLLAWIAKESVADSRFLRSEPAMADLFAKLHRQSERVEPGHPQDRDGEPAGPVAAWKAWELRAIAKHMARGLKEAKASLGFEP